jgi:hypothetical protein
MGSSQHDFAKRVLSSVAWRRREQYSNDSIRVPESKLGEGGGKQCRYPISQHQSLGTYCSELALSYGTESLSLFSP